MSVFRELPQGSCVVKVQYDVEGNIWKNAHGIEKGSYKNVTVPCVSSVSSWSDFFGSSPVGSLMSLFADVLGATFDEDTPKRTITQETADA